MGRLGGILGRLGGLLGPLGGLLGRLGGLLGRLGGLLDRLEGVLGGLTGCLAAQERARGARTAPGEFRGGPARAAPPPLFKLPVWGPQGGIMGGNNLTRLKTHKGSADFVCEAKQVQSTR